VYRSTFSNVLTLGQGFPSPLSAVVMTLEKSNKRKIVEENDPPHPELRTNGGLEMLSDEEDSLDASSDEGEVEEFPEIVTGSESEFDEEETNEESDSDTDESLHIFPKAKTVVSDITKQPKLVYPEIDPEYDSDSSTEEVSKTVG
jgi:ribosome biogenesis protein ERB1